MSLTVEWLETLLKRKDRERCVERAQSMTVSDAVGKYGNFLSEVKRVKVNVILGSGERTTRSVIVKVLPRNEEQKKFVKEMKVFAVEIKMYETVLKPMAQLVRSCGDREENLWCEMIACEPFETIVLEDLCEQGYRNVDVKKQLMDLKTTLGVVSSLGRYHALTYAAHKKDTFDSGHYSKNGFCDENFIRRNICCLIKIASSAIESSWGSKWEETARRINHSTDTLYPKMLALSQCENSELKVLNHGDFWAGNIMVKSDGNGNPVGVKFIDFQLCHYNSFAWDLTHFLYSSVEPVIRRQHFREILEAYASSFNNYVVNYNGTAISPLTLEHVQQEMNRLRLFSFVILITVVAVSTCESEYVMDVDSWTSAGETGPKVNREIYTNPKCKNLIGTDLESLVADGVI